MASVTATVLGETTQCVRRNGHSPLLFDGRCLARFSGIATSLVRWYALAVYQVDAGGYILEIVYWQNALPAKHDAQRAMCHAEFCADIACAIARIENHDPVRDLCPGLSAPNVAVDDDRISAATLQVQASSLRLACIDAIYQYRLAAGQLLTELCSHHLLSDVMANLCQAEAPTIFG